jgi:hypothetical protein
LFRESPQRGRSVAIAKRTGLNQVHEFVRDLQVQGQSALAVQDEVTEKRFV